VLQSNNIYNQRRNFELTSKVPFPAESDKRKKCQFYTACLIITQTNSFSDNIISVFSALEVLTTMEQPTRLTAAARHWIRTL